jgi:hypothetical protein
MLVLWLHVTVCKGGEVFTLWYAFLISALVAERWMFRTSMHVSSLIDGFAQMGRLYRRGRFPRP